MDLQVWAVKGKEKLRSMGVKQWGVLLLAGICCLIIVFPTGEKKENQPEGNADDLTYSGYSAEKETKEDYAQQMEQRVAKLLSRVKDVGRVEVMVTVSSTGGKTVLQDGTREVSRIEETDSAGGSRISVSENSEGTTIFYDIEGVSTPYILSETYPEVTGVVVIAEGSGTGTVDLDILNAVQVLFNLPAHKIRIMKMK